MIEAPFFKCMMGILVFALRLKIPQGAIAAEVEAGVDVILKRQRFGMVAASAFDNVIVAII